MITTTRSGCSILSTSCQMLGMQLLSNSTTVSTVTVTRSPAATRSRPLFFARIFSAMVMPMAIAPSKRSGSEFLLELVELFHAHQVVQLVERSEQIRTIDHAVVFYDLFLEHRDRVHHAFQGC